MEFNQKKLLCFDLDGTLTATSSWEAFNTLLGISPEEDKRLFDLYISGQHSYKNWLVELMNLYNQNDKVTRAQIEEMANNLALREDAQPLIAEARQKEYEIIIVSGSVDVITEVCAQKLGIKKYFSTNKALFNNDRELTDIESMGDERDAKLLLLKEFCLENGFDIEDVVAVGDGGNDREIFIHAKGIVLGENKELAKLTWKKVDSLKEVGEYL